MSMISEMIATDKAKELEQVLLDAVKGNYWSDARSAIKGFCRKNIWPMYVNACDDSYGGHNINPELKNIFEPSK